MNNSTSVRGYLWDNLFYIVMGFVWYKNILMKCLNSMSYDQSRTILIVMIATMSAIGIILNIRKNRNGMSVFANIALPFGLYTALAYISVNRYLFVTVFILAGLISTLFAVVTMCRRIRSKKTWLVIAKRIKRIIVQMQYLFAIGLFATMLVLGGGAFFGSSLLQPEVIATTYEEAEEQTINNNIESVLMLQEELWVDLSVPERLNILQTVANIERRYLGIPHKLNVGVANLGEYTLGYYDDRKHQVIVSLDSLINDPAEEVLNTVCHESYHAYQHCIVSVLENADEESKNLRLFRDARNYAEEFCDYKSGGNGFYDYYYQECEMDAREYAEDAVFDYYKRIEEYLFENKQ